MAIPARRHTYRAWRRARHTFEERGPAGVFRLCLDEARLRTRARLTPPLLTRAGRAHKPVIVGPFLGEVGFEILYWIPLLRRLLPEHGVSPAAVVAISRGGCASWYADVAEGYVDALSLIGQPDYLSSLAARQRAAGDQKQVQVEDLDRDITARARSSAGLPAAATTVHPSVMHARLRDIWAGRRPPAEVEALVRFARLDASSLPPVVAPDFVALRVHHSRLLPKTERNSRWVLELTRALSDEIRIVVPVNSMPSTDHEAVDPGDAAVEQVDVGSDPATNLAAQTGVFATAAAAITTYGGMSYVPLFHGVPTLGLRAAEGDNPVHLEVAQLAAARLGATLAVVDMRETTPREASELAGALAEHRLGPGGTG